MAGSSHLGSRSHRKDQRAQAIRSDRVCAEDSSEIHDKASSDSRRGFGLFRSLPRRRLCLCRQHLVPWGPGFRPERERFLIPNIGSSDCTRNRSSLASLECPLCCRCDATPLERQGPSAGRQRPSSFTPEQAEFIRAEVLKRIAQKNWSILQIPFSKQPGTVRPSLTQSVMVARPPR